MDDCLGKVLLWMNESCLFVVRFFVLELWKIMD